MDLRDGHSVKNASHTPQCWSVSKEYQKHHKISFADIIPTKFNVGILQFVDRVIVHGRHHFKMQQTLLLELGKWPVFV